MASASWLLVPWWAWALGAAALLCYAVYAWAMTADFADKGILTGEQRRKTMATMRIAVQPGLTRTEACVPDLACGP